MRSASAGAVVAAAAITNAACVTSHVQADRAPETASKASAHRAHAEAISVPAGYQVEAVATGLTAPVAVAFDDAGHVYVLEAGGTYEGASPPRLLEIGEAGALKAVATGTPVSKSGRGAPVRGGGGAPWTGVTWYEGAFYVAASGAREGGGQILRVTPEGSITPIVAELPTLGDHRASGPVIGPDGLLYFGIGSATNAGVVGADNVERGWVRRFPSFHDVACKNLVLMGDNYRTPNTLTRKPGSESITGGLVAFGERVDSGEKIEGKLPCTGAILRVPPTGGRPELVAWGFRDPFGLAFTPEGRLVATDTGMEPRGSRPVQNAPDVLWMIEEGRWYGFPDFAAGEPVWHPAGGALDRPPRLLATHPDTPPMPAVRFGLRSSPGRLDFSRSESFGYVGEAFVAQAGDPELKAGVQVVRVALDTGVVTPFAVNRAGPLPASQGEGGGLERPVDARFDPRGEALYVVDVGLLEGAEHKPVKGSGVLWRVTHTKPARAAHDKTPAVHEARRR
ncbi:PQQ-dependent sugar dehydrogenase [Chondromyces crocatus]|nr:PQQ-dependent sugar dehydrogenase [Chondromyces crocatus]